MDSLKNTLNHWWVLLILGILSAIVGLWLLIAPVQGFVALSILFAIVFLVNGVGALFVTIRSREGLPYFKLHLVLNILLIILAIVMLINPGFTASVLIYYSAFAFLYNAVNSIVFSVASQLPGWGMDLFFGILMLILAILLMLNPLLALLTLTTLSGIAFLVAGIAFCTMAWRFYRLGHPKL